VGYKESKAEYTRTLDTYKRTGDEWFKNEAEWWRLECIQDRLFPWIIGLATLSCICRVMGIFFSS
jgi:hypothetical protein